MCWTDNKQCKNRMKIVIFCLEELFASSRKIFYISFYSKQYLSFLEKSQFHTNWENPPLEGITEKQVPQPKSSRGRFLF